MSSRGVGATTRGAAIVARFAELCRCNATEKGKVRAGKMCEKRLHFQDNHGETFLPLRHSSQGSNRMVIDAPPVFDADFAARFEALLRWRRDVRHFSTAPIAEDDLAALLAHAVLAPSVGNSQPWRFGRLRSPALRDALAAHVDAQNAEAAQRYAGKARHDDYVALKLHGIREAPELMAVLCDDQARAGHGLGIATMPEMLRYSCVAAVQNMWLAARIRGIGMGWVSILDPATIKAMLEVPQHWSLIALLCIGYPSAPSDTPELEQRGWQSREPLADRLFER